MTQSTSAAWMPGSARWSLAYARATAAAQPANARHRSTPVLGRRESVFPPPFPKRCQGLRVEPTAPPYTRKPAPLLLVSWLTGEGDGWDLERVRKWRGETDEDSHHST